MIISVHIPKTAGTSFRTGLEKVFGNRLLLDYNDKPLSGLISARWFRVKNRFRVQMQRHILLENFSVIHGHFLPSKYLFLGKEIKLGAFFRDPVDRLISQYCFELNHPHPDPTKAMLWIKDRSRNMTCLELEIKRDKDICTNCLRLISRLIVLIISASRKNMKPA